MTKVQFLTWLAALKNRQTVKQVKGPGRHCVMLFQDYGFYLGVLFSKMWNSITPFQWGGFVLRERITLYVHFLSDAGRTPRRGSPDQLYGKPSWSETGAVNSVIKGHLRASSNFPFPSERTFSAEWFGAAIGSKDVTTTDFSRIPPDLFWKKAPGG